MKLHHLGFVVNDINVYAENFPDYQLCAHVFDEFQKAKIALFSRSSDELIIELVQPQCQKSLVYGAYRKYGNHFNHFCYEMSNDRALEDYVNSERLKKLVDWVEAPVFQNRLVCFYFNRKGQVVEFIK